MMSERTVAICEPNTTDGVVVNTIVVSPSWVNDDPSHLIEYTSEALAGIGWAVVGGVVIVPPPTESVTPDETDL